MAKAKQARKQRKRLPVRIEARDGSDLCLQCGMCCDGTLFSHLVVREEEREHVEGLGLAVSVDEHGNLRSPEPCSAFHDGCCSLYGVARPQTCHEFACVLLTEYLQGRRSLEEAVCLTVVMRVRAAELADEMRIDPGEFSRRRVQTYLEEHAPSSDPVSNAPFLVAFARYMDLGDKLFFFTPQPAEELAATVGRRLQGGR